MGRKSKADERKPEILRSAYEVVKQEGLENTTLARIAEHMGVATSLLTHYFKSKEEIIRQLADYMVGIYDESVLLDYSKITDPKKRIEAILDARLWEFSRQVVEDRVWYDVYNLSLRNERIKKYFKDLYQRDASAVKRELDIVLKDAPDSIDTEALSVAVITMSEGLGYYNSIINDDKHVDAAAALMKDMFMTYFEKLKNN
ncbi:MAG: TetR family transcriptional regulator [Spirochaetales bacterium]|nr:TetR family transcriptional regulator [Spirochaetales bacterium]